MMTAGVKFDWSLGHLADMFPKSYFFKFFTLHRGVLGFWGFGVLGTRIVRRFFV